MRPARFAAIAALLAATPLSAAPGPGTPVAVRFWGQGLVTIETYWNLTVAIDPYALRIGYDDPRIESDLVLVTHEHFDHNNVELIGGTPSVIRGLDDSGGVRIVDVVLDRAPNSPRAILSAATETVVRSAHAIRVRSIPAFHDLTAGTQRGQTALFLIEVDDVRILHCGDLGQKQLTPGQLDAIGTIDVLLIPVGGVFTIDGPQAAQITEQLRPRTVVPIHYKTEALSIQLQTADAFIEALPDRYSRVTALGNTLAVTAGRGPSHDSPAVVVLATRPWAMPDELADLFERKEKAAGAAMEVFARLTVDQMNHRPGNGTHTPRWNAEHMMGRELGFFTAIYAGLDSSIGPLDLNPAQMPDKYRAVHPDWTGAEEARQIERAQRFTRRFAFLLADLDLDDTPDEGSWTLRQLFRQIQGHYLAHTANVRKKFELSDWPGSE